MLKCRKYRLSMSSSGETVKLWGYDREGQLESVKLGNTTLSYRYNLRGQMTAVSSTPFTQRLAYEDGSDPCYNGNISQMALTYSPRPPLVRKFTYDKMDRLISMSLNSADNTTYTYDRNSNPLTVIRKKLDITGSMNTVDALYMTYDGNRMLTTSDSADPQTNETATDFAGDAVYGYDREGRLISDTGRGITNISYTPSGRPVAIEVGSDSRMTYRYSADGRKLSESIDWIGGTSTRHYVGMMEIVKAAEDSAAVIDRVNLPFGYLDGSRQAFTYIRDYQGNVRSVVNSAGTVVQKTDYYPYGSPMASSTGEEVNRYKFGEKEYETRLGLNFHNFEARMLFNDRLAFNRPDDLAGDTPWLSPYIYCAANPIKYIDPTGKEVNFNQLIWADKSLNQSTVTQIVNDLSNFTGLNLSINSNGNLEYHKNNDGTPFIAEKESNGETILVGSETAREFLIGLIDNPEISHVSISRIGSCHDPDTNTIGIDSNQIDWFINNAFGVNGDTLGYGMTFLHEMRHTKLGGSHSDTGKNIGTGAVVDFMNTIRSELNQQGYNFGQRMNYKSIPINGKNVIPFSQSTFYKCLNNRPLNNNDKYIALP